MRGRRDKALGLLLALIVAAFPVHAQPVDWHLAPQPLKDSLTAIARAGKVTVLFDPRLVEGYRTKALTARLEAREALHHLLSGTGLRAVEISPGQFVVERPPAEIVEEEVRRSVKPPDEVVPLVVVKGLKSDLRLAETRKRDSAGIVDTATAGDIARYPEANLAEALQLLPGSALTRDQGEGRTLSVRGMGPELSLVEINGIEAQAVTDGPNFASNRGRGFDFNVFPSELFGQIATAKTTRADQPEGSLGASVFLMTPKPLQLKPDTFQLGASRTYNDLVGERGLRATLLMSDRREDARFGWAVSAAYSRLPFEIQGVSSGNWNTGLSNGGFCRPTLGTGGLCDVVSTEYATALSAYDELNSTEVYHPQFYRYTDILGVAMRKGLTAGIQWEPSDATLLSVDYLRSDFHTRRTGYYLSPIGFSRGAGQGGKPEIVVRDLEIDAQGSVVYGLFDNVDVRSETILDDYSTRFEQVSIQVAQTLGSRLRFAGAAGFSRSRFRNHDELGIHIDRFNIDGFVFDSRGSGQSRPTFRYGFDVSDPGQWYFGPRQTQAGGTGPTGPEIRFRPNFVRNDFDVLKGQLAYQIDDGFEVVLGAQWKRYGFASEVYKFAEGEADFPIPPEGLSTLGRTFCGLDKVAKAADTPLCWFAPDPEAFVRAYDLYANSGRTALSRETSLARGFNQSVRETDLAVFVQARFTGDWHGYPYKGDMGLRLVETRQISRFYDESTSDLSGTPRFESVSRRYVDALPTVNLAVELDPAKVVRVSLARVMARPPLTGIAAATALSVSGASRQIITGNPLLRPIRATSLDLTFEWYVSRDLNMSMGVFYKDIDSYIQPLAYVGRFSDTGLSATVLDKTGASVSDDFLMSRFINTSGGKLRGAEATLRWRGEALPKPFRGLGLDASYTLMSSDMDYVLMQGGRARQVSYDLVNLSPRTARGTLFYKRGRFDAQITAVYRSAYLTSVPGALAMDASGVDSSQHVNAAIAYRLAPNLQIRFEGLNLTNEATYAWEDYAARRLSDVQWSGRTLSVGLSYGF
nr:TonB-dependent receptor [Asticcacaulis aquaticus]